MRNNSYQIAVLTLGLLAVAIGGAGATRADDPCCAHCGCSDACQKVCRLVREDKKVTITCWGCKCEDFCDQGPSCRGCKNCEEVCQSTEKDASGPCVAPKDFVWYEWIPGCSKGIYTKKKLMKKTVTKTVPSFKWVVEDLCAQCEEKSQDAVVPLGVKIPSPPPVGGQPSYER